MRAFRQGVWEKELGDGGLIGDLTDLDRSPIPVITTGDLRRFVPVWENRKYAPPCEASCPTGIPVQERWRLIREGRVDEAVDMALAYTPFPATVCGYLCPNLCMKDCSRQTANIVPVDVKQLGRASLDAKLPELPPLTNKRIAVIGGGPAGISVAWQLRLQGHEAVIYDMEKTLGGKITSAIPKSRIPEEIILAAFMDARYSADQPLSLNASLVFEQSYGGVEGDSASSAELYALLSAIGEVPIKQSLAVTGSVNQHGVVQAIGGVNEKIEWFFDICKTRGLTGDQGVLIPSANVKHLMLRKDVIDAVSNGKFSIYPVDTIDQGLELLSGKSAGEPDENGIYPEDTLNGMVQQNLREMAKQRMEFSQDSKELVG